MNNNNNNNVSTASAMDALKVMDESGHSTASQAAPIDYVTQNGNETLHVDVNRTAATVHGMLPPLIIVDSSYTQYIVPAVFCMIFIIGIIGNGTLIYIVARNKNLRNTPNIFIVSLATGDLLLILIGVPISATYFTFSYWPYGEVVCRLNEFLTTLSLGVSVFTLVALSADRYVAIVYPMSKHKGSATLRTSLIVGGIWALSGSLAIIDLVKTEYILHHDGNYTKPICLDQSYDEHDTYARFRTVFRFMSYFAIPVIVIGTFYALMARILVLSSSRMPGEGHTCNQATRQMEARRKVAKVVLSFVLVFVVCWLPYHIFRFWYYFDPNGEFNNFWLWFKVLSFCMAFANSCINPFALYFLSKQFRGHYNRHLFCCCPRNRHADQNGEYTTTLYQFKNPSMGRPSNSVTLVTSHSVC